MLKKVWKLLLNHEFYEKHKSTLPASAFDEIGQDLLPTLEVAHSSFNRDITEDELLVLHSAQNTTMTTAYKHTVESYIQYIRDTPAVGADMASKIFSLLWRREVGRYVAEYGTRMIDGEHEDASQLAQYVNKISPSLVPQDFDEPVNTDPDALFAELNAAGKWHLNLPVLDVKVGNVSPCMFITILARPDCGKSALVVDLVAGRNGFAAQGAKVHYIANEEQATRTAGRMATCYNQVSIHEAMKNPSLVKTAGWDTIRNNITLVHKPDMSIVQLENYCKTHRPDVLVIDQIDHVQIGGSYEKGHERLGLLYRRVRELCSIYNMLVIAVSQASADAEGKTIVTYAMAEGSKTSKAATADLIIGMGKPDTEEGDAVLRYLTCSKNKISGWKGSAVVKLIQSESRFTA